MILCCILLFLLLAGCSQHTPSTADQAAAQNTDAVTLTTEQARQAGIKLDTPHLGTLARTITLRGTIELPPQNRIRIAIPVGCIVRQIRVLPGMFVRRGTLLCTLEGMQIIELQEQYLAARVQAEQAEREYQRQRELAASEATSDRALRDAESLFRQRRIARAALAERIRLLGLNPAQMSDTTISATLSIVAPTDAFVAAINVTAGQSLPPDQPIMELVDLRDVHVVLRAFEADVPFIEQGQPLQIRIGDGSQLYSGRVVTVGHVLDSTRSTEVHCHFDRYDRERMRPGMSVTAELTTESIRGYRVPRAAVVRWENEHYLFTPDGNQYRMIAVRVHAERADSMIVLPATGSQLPPRIVTSGAYWLLMKLKNTEQE
jgi:cobalt-zinc-cadmium efflux system membrane fusion protein